jgi:hypothetical protein
VTTTHVPLPVGAVDADYFQDDYGSHNPAGQRFVRGPKCSLEGAHIIACCWQRPDGTIVTDEGSAPCVLVGDVESQDFSPDEAREIARHMVAAAALADRWAAGT